MKNLFSFLVLFALALAFSSTVFAADEASDPRPVVKIGVTAPLTGNLSYIGDSVVAWEKYAAQDLAKKPTHFRYEVIIEDDQLQPRQTVLAARRLVDWNKVSVLLTYGSPGAAAIAPWVDQRKIPHIAIAYDPRAVVGNYSVSFSTPGQAAIPAFLELLKKKHYKKIALFSVRNATWQPILEELEKLNAEKKLNIVFERVYVPGERDFRLGFQMMRETEVDAVVFLAWSPEINILGKQYHEWGPKKPIISVGGSLMTSEEHSWFDGSVDVYFADYTRADEINRRLLKLPLHSPGGPMIHDEILFVADIYEKFFTENHRQPTGEEIMKIIFATKDYQFTLGKATAGADKFFYFPITYYRITKDGFKIISFDEL